MKQDFIDFQHELQLKIEALHASTNNANCFLKEAFEIAKKELSAMNAWLETYQFEDEAQEKHFYKTIRSHVIAHFKYYQERCEWELKAPLTEVEQIAYYDEKYKMVIEKLNKLAYVKDYLQAEENEQYALRNSFRISACTVTSPIKNWRPCFQQCLPLADYICCELLLAYLKETYSTLHSQTQAITEKLHWDENLVDISEIIFAIYHSGAIDTNIISLKGFATAFESIFDIKISDNLNNRWRDIMKRKQDPARFLKKMVSIIENKVKKAL